MVRPIEYTGKAAIYLYFMLGGSYRDIRLPEAPVTTVGL